MVEFIQSSGVQGCSRSLVLLLDESYSISNNNWKKQVHATADAIRRPDIVRLLKSNAGTAISVISFDHRVQSRVDWQVIRSQEDADIFAGKLRAIANSQARGTTDIAPALDFSLDKLEESPCRGRAIIDISTDADNQDSSPYFNHKLASLRTLEDARRSAGDAGVTINGIGIDGMRQTGGAVSRELKNKVVTRDGFVMPSSWEDYGEVIYQKLLMELSDRAPEPAMPLAPYSMYAQLVQGRQR